MCSRLLYVIGNLDIGGAERHLLQVLPELQVRGFEPAVYTLSWKGALAPEFTAAGIDVYSPPFAERLRTWPRLLGRPLLLVLTVVRLLALLFAWRPGVVHFFLPEAYLVGGLTSLVVPRLKRVMSRRSLDVYQDRYPLLARVERWLHPRMNAVLGNSRAVTRQLADEGVAENRLGLIYNGLNLSIFDAPFDRNRARADLGLTAEALVLVLVANLIPYKGHADLLRALGGIKDQLPADWRLLCVGRDTGIADELQTLAQDLSIADHVRWMGVRTDIADVLRLSDIGLICSHQEGFSNSILEGMAAGLPMVVTDVGGNGEAVVDGETGYVVPAHQPGPLAKAMATLATDQRLRLSMGRAGRVRIVEAFSLSTCVDCYENLYSGLAEEKIASVSALIRGSDEMGAA